MHLTPKAIAAFAVTALCFHSTCSQSFNPSILQDSRLEPKVDGTFGFMYRTEDGIAHAAKGDSNGVIQGRFTYTDPTGLKVNYNYNAGSRVAPGYDYDAPPTPRQHQAPSQDYSDSGEYREPQQFRPQQYRPQQEYREPQYRESSQYREPQNREPQYSEPQYNKEPQPRRQQYRPQPQYSEPREYSRRPSPQYRDPADVYQQRKTRPLAKPNEIYDFEY